MRKPLQTIEKLRSGKPLTIAAIGDSLTRGWMVRKGFLDFFQEMLLRKYPDSRLTIINRGIPGDTADSGLYRLRYDVLDYNPDCVFVQFGLNDASLGFTRKQFRDTIAQIIEDIRNDGDAEIVLLTSSYIGNSRENNYVEDYYHALDELGEIHGLPVARVHEYWKNKIGEGVDFRSLVQYDFVHPTVEGYRLMAEAVMMLFE